MRKYLVVLTCVLVVFGLMLGCRSASTTVSVEKPVFSPVGGNFTDNLSVTIGSATKGASIRYTIDGSDPTSSKGIQYVVPVILSGSATIKAIAYEDGWSDSGLGSATFYRDLAGEVTTLAGMAGISGSVDGTGTAARFNVPAGIATDGTNLYIADVINHTIRQIVIASGTVSTLAGVAGVPGSANGTGSAAHFMNPEGLACDGSSLYVSDAGNHTIRKIVIATGAVSTLAGTAGSPGSMDGIGSAALFYSPEGIAIVGSSLYVTEFNNYTIRKIDISSGAVTTFAGAAGISGSKDDTGTAARFYHPCGIVSDGTNLYVVDAANYTIRKIVIATAVVTTLAGSAGVSGNADGTEAAARFNAPRCIAIYEANLYVTSYGHTIRKVVAATGEVTTFAGLDGTPGATDGRGKAARFNQPFGIIGDGKDFFVTEVGNYTVRRIQ